MFFKIFLQCLLFTCVYCVSKHPILIVVSYDAFRYNFFDTAPLPNMVRLRNQGAHAEYLINVFPTKTFPNHYSIATGLYPEVHGVIGNTFYDPVSKKVSGYGYEMFHYDNHVKPIWRWNEDAGNDRHSGAVMWPGSNFPYQGKNITHIKAFQDGFDWYQRVDMAISWIKDPKKPANLVMVYFEEPDTHGHAFGPNSKTVRDMLVRLDNITYYLEKQLELNNLTEKVNVIHLSDHGMSTVTPPTFINITQYIKNGTYEWAGASPVLQIIPHEGYEDTIYNSLKEGSLKNGHYKVYKKDEFLSRWNYKNNPRSPPILVMADVGYALDDLIIAAPRYAQKYNFTLTNTSEFGVHGYDYEVADMRPIFMARGPKIKKQHKVDPFHTVDLFNLFSEILEITPTMNNGTLSHVKDVLVNDAQGNYSVGSILIISDDGTSAGFLKLLIGFCCLTLFF